MYDFVGELVQQKNASFAAWGKSPSGEPNVDMRVASTIWDAWGRAADACLFVNESPLTGSSGTDQLTAEKARFDAARDAALADGTSGMIADARTYWLRLGKLAFSIDATVVADTKVAAAKEQLIADIKDAVNKAPAVALKLAGDIFGALLGEALTTFAPYLLLVGGYLVVRKEFGL